jgi:uncharacterized protein YecE (DUF72 family)
MAAHIGTSGWSYKHWKGVIYREGTPGTKWLEVYAERFQTVEVNNSFYHWPRDETFAAWRTRLPEGFLMSVKAPRPLTHYQKLHEPGPWLARMSGSLHRLGKKMGVLLVQLPPTFAYHLERLKRFLDEVTFSYKLAFEFRHPSWDRDEVYELLERRGAAYCVMSGPHLPCILRLTAPFVYVRFHGTDTRARYAGGYPDDELRIWAKRMAQWEEQGREVFAYFNNDVHGHAVRNAETLRTMLDAITNRAGPEAVADETRLRLTSGP